MTGWEVLMHLLGGMGTAVLPVALGIWCDRLVYTAGVPFPHPRAERWLLAAMTVAAGGLLGWGASAGRSGAVELSGALVLLTAGQAWLARRRRRCATPPIPSARTASHPQ